MTTRHAFALCPLAIPIVFAGSISAIRVPSIAASVSPDDFAGESATTVAQIRAALTVDRNEASGSASSYNDLALATAHWDTWTSVLSIASAAASAVLLIIADHVNSPETSSTDDDLQQAAGIVTGASGVVVGASLALGNAIGMRSQMAEARARYPVPASEVRRALRSLSGAGAQTQRGQRR